MTATGLACAACGTDLPQTSKFCNECGAAVSAGAEPAEYKQVTVLFVDVVHSMDIAAAVGAERLREIMTQLVNRAALLVQRYGGTVDKFTGDGIMAVFGAPVALEDHAFRAPVWRRWASRRRLHDWRSRSNATTVWTCADVDAGAALRSSGRQAPDGQACRNPAVGATHDRPG
jgi:class 3 adenylate cyclase